MPNIPSVQFSVCRCQHLEAGPLPSACLLLHGHNLHDLVLQGGAQEVVHNLALLDGHGEQVYLLQALDFALHTTNG
jgi:hypothetical protein